MTTGTRVIIADRSEADGDHGSIDTVQADGLILVLLDQGCIWPVDGPHELLLEPDPEYARARAKGEREARERLAKQMVVVLEPRPGAWGTFPERKT